ncbi:cytidine and deoxycytidylate deaminase [Ophiostoma piceae UAMH 11346]|uniref:Cytidine and deoxycytidylate deaminase n=1 Tax=Ophiostoma piceae (strain UAMH 11346) TaxID=1262450 RepID=S3C5Y3_OPHP1|nr:cytidine and deoxycytidylate deaminase [Ophiostoma piceae UAMH 11346]
MSDDRHIAYMRQALSLARLSPPKPSNYRVGAVLVGEDEEGDTGGVIATGYTLECPGNTHAEQCCFIKLAEQYGVAEEDLSSTLTTAQLPRRLALYTTMEPCSFRMSGNLPCVQRVLRLAGNGLPNSTTLREITVYCGVTEPDTFVSKNTGRATLENAGIAVVHVPGLEEDILAVATAGHAKEDAEAQ